MVRRLIAIAVGEVLVLAGGIFLLHDTVGFALPQLTLGAPQITWPSVLIAFSEGLAAVNWTLVWPAFALSVRSAPAIAGVAFGDKVALADRPAAFRLGNAIIVLRARDLV